MFKLKFANTYDNYNFTKFGLKPVVEDYYKIKGDNFCIADGVTRDDILGNALEYPKNYEEAIKWLKIYPNPSGAYKAAKIIADYFVDKISLIDNVDKSKVKKIIFDANKELKKINNDRKIDYLKNDYYCCVSIGGCIRKDKLYAFSIGDCRLMIFDNKYNNIFSSLNNHEQFEEYEKNYLKKIYNYNWKDSNYRVLVRKEYRNNPDKIINGKNVSFGVLSGEKNAEFYIDTYEIDIKNAKYICAYSDGCKDFFSKKETIKKIIDNPYRMQKTNFENTLIIYERI